MIFWDTSAVVPLLIDEPHTQRSLERLQIDPDMVVWWSTVVECSSAIARLEREGAFSADAASDARNLLAQLAGAWYAIQPVDDVRDHARRLLHRHPLTAADALQLGAALAWAEARPSGHRFRTYDARLARAARAEGFAVEGAEA